MKKHLELIATLVFAVAIACTTGCKKDDLNNGENNDGGGGTVTPTYPTGAINGLFSVSADKQVYFSQGNLQYQASTNTWRFAENQWDWVGGENSIGQVCGNVYENGVRCCNNLISDSYDGWIDLFGWGTSGWNSGFNCYQPYSISEDEDDYYFGSGGEINPNIDWGRYNAILNGGNTAGLWRTLTKEEWEYVITERETNSGARFAFAVVNGVIGLILLPDDWDANVYPLNHINEIVAASDSNYNIIDNDVWINNLENKGAVFLPETDCRIGSNYSSISAWGAYWSISQVYNHVPHNRVCFCYTFDGFLNTWLSWFPASYGISVRLVQDYH